MHTLLPMVGIGALLGARSALKRIGRAEIGGRCVTAAFYIVFFIYPSVSAKVCRAVLPYARLSCCVSRAPDILHLQL